MVYHPIIMSSFHPSILDAFRFDPLEARSLKLVSACKGRQELFMSQTPEVLENLRLAALVESVESSNRIEGIVTSRERMEAMVRHGSLPQSRAEEEITGYRDALAEIHGNGAKMDISESTALLLHAFLFREQAGTGGHYKRTDNLIVARHSDGTESVRFRPVSAKNTQEAMRQWVLQFMHCRQEGVEPLLAMPLLILDFLCIHPFSDGNGRVSRLLTLLLSYHYGYEVGRYISLERVVEQSKDRYYLNLRESSQGWHEHRHDVHPWVNYFLSTLLVAYAEFERRVQNLRDSRGDKSILVRNAALEFLAAFSLAELQAKCPEVSAEQIRRVVRKLRAEGALRLLSRGRDAKYQRIFN